MTWSSTTLTTWKIPRRQSSSLKTTQYHQRNHPSKNQLPRPPNKSPHRASRSTHSQNGMHCENTWRKNPKTLTHGWNSSTWRRSLETTIGRKRPMSSCLNTSQTLSANSVYEHMFDCASALPSLFFSFPFSPLPKLLSSTSCWNRVRPTGSRLRSLCSIGSWSYHRSSTYGSSILPMSSELSSWFVVWPSVLFTKIFKMYS